MSREDQKCATLEEVLYTPASTAACCRGFCEKSQRCQRTPEKVNDFYKNRISAAVVIGANGRWVRGVKFNDGAQRIRKFLKTNEILNRPPNKDIHNVIVYPSISTDPFEYHNVGYNWHLTSSCTDKEAVVAYLLLGHHRKKCATGVPGRRDQNSVAAVSVGRMREVILRKTRR